MLKFYKLSKILFIVKKHRSDLENFLFLVVVNVLAAAVAWLTQIKIANSLGKEVFGQVSFGFALGTYGQVIIRFGLDRTLVRDLVHHPENFGHIVKASLYLRYLVTFIILSLFIFYANYTSIFQLSSGVVFIAISSSVLSLDLQAVYDAWQNMRRHATYFLIQKIIYLSLVWGCIIFYSDQLSPFFIGLSLFISVSFYLYLQHMWAMLRLQVQPSSIGGLGRDVISLAKKNYLVWLASIGSLITIMLNQPVLIRYKGFKELGGYAAAWQVMMVGNLFLNQISRIGRPAMARKCLPEISRNLRIAFILKYSMVMVGAVLPLACGMIFFSDYVFSSFFKHEYYSASNTLPLFGYYLILYALGIVSSQYILSVNLEKSYFLSVVVGAILSFLLCFLLIPKYGSFGAALSLLLAHGGSMLIYIAAMVSHLRSYKLCH